MHFSSACRRRLSARPGIHNEGAALLGERLRGKLEVDPDTLRRLFTLMTALHYKG